MSKANDTQVGGQHYQNLKQQHWDRIVDMFGWPGARPYFVGNITAYIERYWQKNGVQDLHKAKHYIEKLIELEEAHLIDINKPSEPCSQTTLSIQGTDSKERDL